MEENKWQLFDAAKTGTLDDVQTAFEACSVDEQNEYGYGALCSAAHNVSSHALKIVEYLIERGVEPDYKALHEVTWNRGPCALDIAKLMMEHGADPHKKDGDGFTTFTKALDWNNLSILKHLFFRDDFCLSDLMPCSIYLSTSKYSSLRAIVISRVSELVDVKGLPYARTVMANIEKILKTSSPEPTQEDIKALEVLVRKIATKDWVADAQVSSDAFMSCDIER